MDKRTLKSKIIELRDIEGKSFREISDELALKYGIRMTRQAVCGMYNRATEPDKIIHNRDLMLAVNDIVNYFTLGKEAACIKEILANNNYSFSVSEIESIINGNSKYIKDIKEDQLKRVKIAILNGDDYSDIIDKLSYKNVKPNEYVINDMIKLAASTIINDRAVEVLAKVYTINENKALVKDIVQSFKLNASYSSVSKYLN